MNLSQLSKIININSPILITGPSGTGKSQMAQKIFKRSRINRDQFLVLHLASIKEDLLESELFGHRKGSFTGASENKLGYFQEVGKGTLFLDEIGELSLESQKKLLYVLEEKKFTPIGSTAAFDFQGRLIVATNKDLKAMVAAGSFREDLFFRLSVFHLELDPIHKNKEILLSELRRQFEAMKILYQKNHLKLGVEIESLMLNAVWKGNFRELKNCLEYMVVVSDGLELKKEDFPEWFLSDLKPNQAQSEIDFISHFPQDFNQAIESFEEWYLKAMFERFEGRVNETSRLLGMSKTTLINKAKKYQINTLQIRARASAQKETRLAA
ncbi:MAG: sigma-54-dependent Fis family transcriptional regulator [Bacteriovorax sp.]|nr:sigma-54-dependent Fis family transcriptional regulator [Bacteriovorax sp.]